MKQYVFPTVPHEYGRAASSNFLLFTESHIIMASSNRSLYTRQESTHPHLTAPPNNFPPVAKPPRKHPTSTARMTTPNTALIAPNGIYSNDVPLHQIDPDRQLPPQGMTLEFALNGSHDGNETLDEIPRKRAHNEPHEYPRRRVTTAVNITTPPISSLILKNLLFSVKFAVAESQDAMARSHGANYVPS